jgi:hypothetical protein
MTYWYTIIDSLIDLLAERRILHAEYSQKRPESGYIKEVAKEGCFIIL